MGKIAAICLGVLALVGGGFVVASADTNVYWDGPKAGQPVITD